jgi:hypothetical protein
LFYFALVKKYKKFKETSVSGPEKRRVLRAPRTPGRPWPSQLSLHPRQKLGEAKFSNIFLMVYILHSVINIPKMNAGSQVNYIGIKIPSF